MWLPLPSPQRVSALPLCDPLKPSFWHVLFSLCLVASGQSGAGAGPRQTRGEEVNDAAPWKDKQSHEAMSSQTKGQKTTSQARLEHRASGSPAPSGNRYCCICLPYLPVHLRACQGKTYGEGAGTKLAETRVQIPCDLEEIISLF